MIKAIKALILVFIVCLITAAVYATITVLKPTAYSTVTSTSVNLSMTYNSSTGLGSLHLLSIHNKSSSAGSYGVLTTRNVTNNTFWNLTYTLKDKTRYWIYYNITNVTSGVITTVASPKIFDIDSKYNTFQLGTYDTLNFTQDTGDVAIAGGIVTGQALGSETTCATGEIRGNVTDNSICLCTSTNAWKCATVS